MRSFDLAPLYRSTVGFDRLFALMNQLEALEAPAQSFPPYNIEKVSETEYRVTIAVAGFTEADLAIETKENSLLVRGEKRSGAEAQPSAFLFQGIAARQFERRFQLADYVSVTGARLENGLLHIDLVREIPEAKRPRAIPIGERATLKTVEQIAA